MIRRPIPLCTTLQTKFSVDAFLRGQLAYLSIVDLLEEVLAEHQGIDEPTLDDILGAQEWAKASARSHIM